MSRRLLSAPFLAAALAACSSATASRPSPTQAGPTSTLNLATQSTAMFSHTHSVACDLDLDAMETAVTDYEALYGSGHVTEADMVAKGTLRAQSELHDVQLDGTVVPAPGGPCQS